MTTLEADTDDRSWALPDGNQLALGCTPRNFNHACPEDMWEDPEYRLLEMTWIREMSDTTLRAYIQDYEVAMRHIAEGTKVPKKTARGSRQTMWCARNPQEVEKMIAFMRMELQNRRVR